MIEYVARSPHGDSLHYVFQGREVHPVFDRQWHKLGFGVRSGVLSLYVDCSLIEQKLTDEKTTTDFQGKVLIAAHSLDGKPVDVSDVACENKFQ